MSNSASWRGDAFELVQKVKVKVGELVGRAISVIIFLSYLVGFCLHGRPTTAAVVGGYLLVPLSFIWFSDRLGRRIGISEQSRFVTPRPEGVMELIGWLLLLSPLLVLT